MCFSIIGTSSFDNIKTKWVPEIRHHCPDTPILLCGTKVDLRDDKSTIEKLASKGCKPITKEQGEQCAKDIGAIAYIETSSLQKFNLVKCFELVVAASYIDEEAWAKRNKQTTGTCSVQ